MSKQLLSTFSIACLLAGCSPVPVKPIPAPDGVYSSPESVESNIGYIESTLSDTGVLGGMARAMVSSIDRKTVVPSRNAQQAPVAITAGKHLIVAICEPKYGSTRPLAAFEIEIEAKHKYVLKCEATNQLLNLGTDISIEDATAGNKVLSIERTWAPDRGGVQRNF